MPPLISPRVFTGARTDSGEERKNVVLTLRISRDPLPKKPTYDELGVEEKKEFFLVTKDHFDVTKTFSEEEARRVEDTTATVWLLGYVDYQDKFGRSHRGGYARRYDRSPYLAAGNNLVFESKPGYNYDTK